MFVRPLLFGALALGTWFQATTRAAYGQVPASERLENGLLVVAWPSETAGMELTTAYFVGYRDEPEAQSGATHLLEHIAMRETRREPSLAAAMARLGARSGAMTTADVTYFSATKVPASYPVLNELLELERQRMMELRITADGIESERRRIRVEIGRRSNPPGAPPLAAAGGRLSRSSGHEGIDSIGPDDLRELHGRYYSPGNAMVVVSSPFSAQRVFEAARAVFGAMSSRPAPPRPVHRDSTNMRARIEIERGGDAATAVMTVPGPQHPDRPRLEHELALLRGRFAERDEGEGSLRLYLTMDAPVSMLRIRARAHTGEAARSLLDRVLADPAGWMDPGEERSSPAPGVTELIACEAAGDWRYCFDGTAAVSPSSGRSILAELIDAAQYEGDGARSLTLWPAPVRSPAVETAVVDGGRSRADWVAPEDTPITWWSWGPRARWAARGGGHADSIFVAAWAMLPPDSLTAPEVAALELFARTWESFGWRNTTLADSLDGLGASVSVRSLPYPSLATGDPYRVLGVPVTPVGTIGLQVLLAVPRREAGRALDALRGALETGEVDAATVATEIAGQLEVLTAAAEIGNARTQVAFRRSLPVLPRGAGPGWRPQELPAQVGTMAGLDPGTVQAVPEMLRRRATLRVAVLGAEPVEAARLLGTDDWIEVGPGAAPSAVACADDPGRSDPVVADDGSSIVYFGLCVPEGRGVGVPPELDVANAFLGRREDAVIAHRLRSETGLVYDLAARVLPTGGGATLWYLRVGTRPEDRIAVIAEVRRLLAVSSRRGVPQARIEEFRDWLAAQRGAGIVDGQRWTRFLVAEGTTPEWSAAEIRAVSPAAVLAILRTFDPGRLVITAAGEVRR